MQQTFQGCAACCIFVLKAFPANGFEMGLRYEQDGQDGFKSVKSKIQNVELAIRAF
ncbi:MAG: hypothetical protein II221_05335 [Paludibacteraceae bacterium]|nr:hypothetical protein [Paludibacteraceae bacterium]